MNIRIMELFNQLPPYAQQEAVDFIEFLSHKIQKQIQKKANVCGGDACIRNTRITVWLLYSLQQQGASDSELLTNYPMLTQADLDAAWAYQYHNPKEIQQAIVANE